MENPVPRGLLAGRYHSTADLIPWYHHNKPLPFSPTWLYSTNFIVRALQSQCRTPTSLSTRERVGKAHSANTVSVSKKPQTWTARTGTCSNTVQWEVSNDGKIHHPGNCRFFSTSWRKPRFGAVATKSQGSSLSSWQEKAVLWFRRQRPTVLYWSVSTKCYAFQAGTQSLAMCRMK